MKFISFNINGIRAHFHQLIEIIVKYNPDVIGLQEIKVQDIQFPIEKILCYGYYSYFYGQKGHYGVAILTKKKPFLIQYGLSSDDFDKFLLLKQRRIIIAGFMTSIGVLTVVNVYSPSGENRKHPTKFLDKYKFYKNLINYIKNKFIVNKMSLILIMGDMNISIKDIDIGISDKCRKYWLNTGKCSFLPEERIWMDNLLSTGLVDVYRELYPTNKNKFSWFDYRSNGFIKNMGLRIDLFLVSYSLFSVITDTGMYYYIRSMNKPSDHVPIWIDFNVTLL